MRLGLVKSASAFLVTLLILARPSLELAILNAGIRVLFSYLLWSTLFGVSEVKRLLAWQNTIGLSGF